VTSDFRPEVKIRPFRARAMKNVQYNPYLWPNCRNFRVLRKSGPRNTMVSSDLKAEVEIWPFRSCAMHPGIGTVRSLWTWLWGRYHVITQNVFLVYGSLRLNLCYPICQSSPRQKYMSDISLARKNVWKRRSALPYGPMWLGK